jgi:hypothetical protein
LASLWLFGEVKNAIRPHMHLRLYPHMYRHLWMIQIIHLYPRMYRRLYPHLYPHLWIRQTIRMALLLHLFSRFLFLWCTCAEYKKWKIKKIEK